MRKDNYNHCGNEHKEQTPGLCSLNQDHTTFKKISSGFGNFLGGNELPMKRANE